MTAAVLGAPSRRGEVLVAVASFLAPTANVKFLKGLSPRERMKWSWKPKGGEMLGPPSGKPCQAASEN